MVQIPSICDALNSFLQLLDLGFTTQHIGLVRRPTKIGVGFHYGFLVFFRNRFTVFHLRERGGIRRSSVNEFFDGHPIKIEKVCFLDSEAVSRRINYAIENYSQYSLLWNNCEDFARYLFEEKWLSYQVMAGIAGLSLYALAR